MICNKRTRIEVFHRILDFHNGLDFHPGHLHL